jgi:glycosyltransferase involved in cell wall biosynthesis
MNFLYTLTAYPPSLGGAQLHQHYLAKAFLANHWIQVICHWDVTRIDWLLGTTLRQPEQYNYSWEGVEVHRLGLKWLDKLSLLPAFFFYYPLMPWAVTNISRVLMKSLAPYAKELDLIHNVRIGREGISFASLQLARRCNVPFVLTPVHHPRWRGWRYRVYDKIYRAGRCCDCLDSLVSVGSLLEVGVADERIHITGHGPSLWQMIGMLRGFR